MKRLCTPLSSSNSMTFHDFFNDLFKFSKTSGLVVTFKNFQNFPSFGVFFEQFNRQAWKIKCLNSMTFQVFHDLYKPWMNNLPVMFAFFSSHWLTCGVTKNCWRTAVERIKMTKPCKILFNKTRFLYKLVNLLFQISHIMFTINELLDV